MIKMRRHLRFRRQKKRAGMILTQRQTCPPTPDVQRMKYRSPILRTDRTSATSASEAASLPSSALCPPPRPPPPPSSADMSASSSARTYHEFCYYDFVDVARGGAPAAVRGKREMCTVASQRPRSRSRSRRRRGARLIGGRRVGRATAGREGGAPRIMIWFVCSFGGGGAPRRGARQERTSTRHSRRARRAD